MKTAILIHGRHLHSHDWKEIAWGDPVNGILGRIPRGIAEAWRHNADLIYWGTGASEKDGVKEAQYSIGYAFSHSDVLADMLRTGLTGEQFGAWLAGTSFLNCTCQNTADEIRGALAMCSSARLEELYLVSSPDHAPRCVRDAARLAKEMGVAIRIYGVPSDTGDPAQTIILEEPHRPDRARAKLNGIARRLLPFSQHADVADDLERDLVRILEEYEKKI